jgi:hypothetical protein
MVSGLKLYFDQGIEPGSFMASVLSNDLKEACGRADYINQRLIFETVSWLYNEAPLGSWGSPENYTRMIANGGLNGESTS